MSERTFDLLKMHDGKSISINGATQIRAGVIRPEIVIPLNNKDSSVIVNNVEINEGIKKGSMVRVIRTPYFGQIGKVVALPSELRIMESETSVRVAEVEIGGEIFIVPRSNLEKLETDWKDMKNKKVLSFNSQTSDLSLNRDDKRFLKLIANKIHKYGMVTPAIFFLEMSKPFSLIGSHFLVFFGPIINAFIQTENYYRSVELFEEPKNLEYLLKLIEEIDKNEW